MQTCCRFLLSFWLDGMAFSTTTFCILSIISCRVFLNLFPSPILQLVILSNKLFRILSRPLSIVPRPSLICWVISSLQVVVMFYSLCSTMCMPQISSSLHSTTPSCLLWWHNRSWTRDSKTPPWPHPLLQTVSARRLCRYQLVSSAPVNSGFY